MLYEWDYFLMQLGALTIDVGWSREQVTETFNTIVAHLVFTVSVVNISF